jgi:peptidoglycan hydrolase CwlO-like protein
LFDSGINNKYYSLFVSISEASILGGNMSLTTNDLKQIRDVFDSAFDAKFDARVIPRFEKAEGEIKALRNDIKDIYNDMAIMKSDISFIKSDIINLKNDMTVVKSDIKIMRTNIQDLQSVA